MKVAVYGTGGVGGYFGGRLAQAGAEVHLIARGAHLEALRRDGLEVRSLKGDFHLELPATEDPGEVGPSDYVLFTVKSYDTEEAATRLAPLIGEETAVVSLQNGIDNEEKIAARVGRQHVMGGLAYILATIAAPGVIEHTAGPSILVFGEMDGSLSSRGRRLLEVCQEAGIDATLSDDIRGQLWTKFAFICALSGMTAVTQLPVGEIRSVEESRTMLRRLLEEVVALAAAEGVELPVDLVDRHLALADQLEPQGRSSLHYDMSHGKRMELEALHGTVVRRAARRSVPVPMSEAVYSLLRPWAVRNEPPG